MINARNRVPDNDDQDIDDDKNGQLFGQTDYKENVKNTKNLSPISEVDILSTSFGFLVAGFETTSATIGHLLHSMVANEDCQQRLYEEIKKYGPEFTYEDITRMPYLEACVAETLRLFSPISGTSRQASQDYKLGKSGCYLLLFLD